MEKYHKIQSIFKRHEKTFKFTDEYACPEFEMLKDIQWVFTEKVNGTNIRIIWDGENMRIAGRTDNAQIPTFLYDRLVEMLPVAKLKEKLSNPLCLYGEGYGAKVQKGGGNYIANGVSFVLFDVKVDNWWLKRKAVEEIAQSLDIETVPIIGAGTLQDAVVLAKSGFQSKWGDFLAEGIVIKPPIDLFNRQGHRIITKVKHKDFKET